MSNYSPPDFMYPFSAIVGQDAMKSALMLNAINPGIGGVLIQGEKGTAKSTAVRALANILPKIDVVEGCPYSCDPNNTAGLCDRCRNEDIRQRNRRVRVVNLPLNATEEMVLGGLDFSATIGRGVRVFQPGLMARANRGILYIDEVNLLADHLTDAILDVSTSGNNVVKREGITHSHPARFILVGTMNPEEGELRPQLLDRFGLFVHAKGEQSILSRIEVIKRRDLFDRDPTRFITEFQAQDALAAERILHARELLPNIEIPKSLGQIITAICLRHRVAGHRADLVIVQTARALAAFEGRRMATLQDIHRAAVFAVPHRSRKLSVEDDSGSVSTLRPEHPKYFATLDIYDYPEQEPAHIQALDSSSEELNYGPARKPVRSDSPEAIFDIGEVFRVIDVGFRTDRRMRHTAGKRSQTPTKHKRGRYVKSTPRRQTNDIALDATIRAAAPYQSVRRNENGLAMDITDGDIREKVRETKTGNFLLFMVDASGSMGAKGRMIASKGAIMSLLKDAYQKRDRVAMVSFRKNQAVVNLPPTSSIYRAGKLLQELPVGGKTPLAAGLRKGGAVLRNVMLKDPNCRPIMIVITDGKANESVGKGDPFWEALSAAKGLASDKRIKSIVVDAEEQGGFRYGFSARLAEILHAKYFRIKDLRADMLLEIVRSGI